MKFPAADIVLFVFTLLGGSWSVVNGGEFFTSISELETLVRTEGELAKTIENYVQEEERRLQILRRLGKEYQKLYDSAVGNPEAFLSHPVHAYMLIKHLTANWEEVIQLVEDAKAKISDLIKTITLKNLKFPGNDDLMGASLALFRLQETYLINTTKVANGELVETTKSLPLPATDCFVLGFQAFLDEDYQYSILWLQETLKKLETESTPTAKRILVMDQLALANFMVGNAKEAKRIIQKVLEEDPNHLSAHSFMELFDQYIRNDEAGLVSDIEKEKRAKGFRYHRNTALNNYEKYEKLCRGERLQKLEEQKQLRCRYRSLNNSFLLLQPVKEEELSLNPRIVIYHDIISDHDVDILKKLSSPRLERARVQSPEASPARVTKNRVSKSTSLPDTEHPVVAKATRRMQAIIGLTASSAEDLHVVNYGIGGFYQPHYDFSIGGVAEVFSSLGIGNRIATWIYYLSDVEGGYTVFPDIGVQVKPRKGSAAFWFNLKRSGDGDLKTMHAACPVLIGSKWVANKWFHETDNEFRRKCSLNREE